MKETRKLIFRSRFRYNLAMGSRMKWKPKRKYVRISLALNGEYAIRDDPEKGRRYPAQIRNIGGGGAMILTPSPLLPGTELQIRFKSYSRPVMAHCSVVWTAPPQIEGPEGYLSGLKFEPVTQVSLLNVDFLVKKEKNSVRENA